MQRSNELIEAKQRAEEADRMKSVLDVYKRQGVCLISTHLFGCPLPTFYQFVLGWINLFNFTKSLNNMKTLGNFLGRWAFGGLGG